MQHQIDSYMFMHVDYNYSEVTKEWVEWHSTTLNPSPLLFV